MNEDKIRKNANKIIDHAQEIKKETKPKEKKGKMFGDPCVEIEA